MGVRIFRNPVASSSWYFSTLQPRHWRVGDQTPPSCFCVLIFHLGNGQIRLMERGRWQGCPVFSSLTPHPRLLPLSLQEALHARDKKRVNKLLFFSQDWPGWFNPSSHLPYPHPTRPPPVRRQPPVRARKGQMGGGIDPRPEPGPRPRRGRADRLTTRRGERSSRQPMGTRGAAVAGQRARDEGRG